MEIKKNEIGTYIQVLINDYNKRATDGKTHFEILNSLKKEILNRRKDNK